MIICYPPGTRVRWGNVWTWRASAASGRGKADELWAGDAA
jgi:hypothetical protein